ncbi:hypothetical protein FA95DRAFT_1612562 [Auriscalpium vulgare]|uniref:Uncharacterized protein n=1 Tax=Auriscalpium vulgare TaxID=40419 RepID=A0ACB8R751_9AGAM|nr:hypothetical protein FA95DRAFT_1612562 [Auriscalpium vulgare]
MVNGRAVGAGDMWANTYARLCDAPLSLSTTRRPSTVAPAARTTCAIQPERGPWKSQHRRALTVLVGGRLRRHLHGPSTQHPHQTRAVVSADASVARYSSALVLKDSLSPPQRHRLFAHHPRPRLALRVSLNRSPRLTIAIDVASPHDLRSPQSALPQRVTGQPGS